MTDEKKKMTAHSSSVGADDGQSISQNSKTTIPDPDEKSNSPERHLEELYRKMRRMSDPAYLHTVTLDELMDNVFEGKSAVIENLLYTGAYILAGAPKIGKSFLVAQIAHHVSTGQDLWGYKVHQGTVLYLALEDDESRLQRRMFRMFGVEGTSSLHFATNAKRLGVVVEPLNGKERLRVLHQIFHMDGQEPFQFSWDWLAPSGLSTKDFIAPSSFSFPNGKTFCMGKKFGAVSFVQILAPELNDRMLADFLDMESSLIVNLHIQSVDQVSAIKTIKRKITDLDRAKIEEQKKAVRSGYDMDIIPSDLATYGTEAKKLLQDLQSRNERMFLLTFLVLNTADSQRQLANNVFQASSIAQKHNCQLTRLDFQQEEGLMSSLPLGYNQIEIQRGLTTSSVAIFVPFTTQELFQDGKEALYGDCKARRSNESQHFSLP